jgi:hypothetical protein
MKTMRAESLSKFTTVLSDFMQSDDEYFARFKPYANKV